MAPEVVGDRHYQCAQAVKEVLQRYRELQDIIAILGLDELSEEDRLTRQPGPEDPALLVPAVLRRPRSSPACPASTCPIDETVRSFEALVGGELDDVPEQAFFNVGGVDDVIAKAKTIEH